MRRGHQVHPRRRIVVCAKEVFGDFATTAVRILIPDHWFIRWTADIDPHVRQLTVFPAHLIEHLQAGFIVGTDRFDIKRSFPLLTISIAVTLSENLENPSLSMISLNCASMKDHLKRLKGSNYLIDRRKQLS